MPETQDKESKKETWVRIPFRTVTLVLTMITILTGAILHVDSLVELHVPALWLHHVFTAVTGLFLIASHKLVLKLQALKHQREVKVLQGVNDGLSEAVNKLVQEKAETLSEVFGLAHDQQKIADQRKEYMDKWRLTDAALIWTYYSLTAVCNKMLSANPKHGGLLSDWRILLLAIQVVVKDAMGTEEDALVWDPDDPHQWRDLWPGIHLLMQEMDKDVAVPRRLLPLSSVNNLKERLSAWYASETAYREEHQGH